MTYRFEFTITGTKKSDVLEVYSGVLPVETEDELREFAREFRNLLLKYSPSRIRLTPRKPPKGMVRIKKASGEESE